MDASNRALATVPSEDGQDSRGDHPLGQARRVIISDDEPNVRIKLVGMPLDTLAPGAAWSSFPLDSGNWHGTDPPRSEVARPGA